MNNLLVAIAVFVITVVGALFAVPHFIDWNSYRSAFEEEAKNVIGRAVEVDGDVTLHLLPTPYFRVEKVRIADTSTTLSEHFFKTESLSIKLSIAPLLRGVVEANEIEFQRPVLRVAMDAKGRWNWQSFAQALLSTGYVPPNVTLTSLRVVDGVLALHDSDGVERTRLDGVNGELSTPALDGPYRFRGTFSSSGAAREVRIGTGAPESDGKVPIRIALRLLDTGASYVLDARAIDLMGKARVEGDLSARLPIAGPPPDGRSQRVSIGSDDEPKIDQRETPLEVKAAIKADVAGAALSDLTLTFEQGSRPQTVTGTARAAWRTPVSVDMDLTSRWLDLDQLAGATEGTGPATSVTKLAAWVRDLLPGDGLTRVGLSVDQANLAGEAIGPLRLALARSAGRLEIGELRTTLPGGTSVGLKGEVAGAADALSYKGDVGVKGTSAARFLAWASGGALAMPADADGAFDLRAKIAIEPGQAAVRDLAGTLAGNALKGSGRYRWAGRPELTVALEGGKLDVRGLLPANLSLADAFGLFGRAPPAQRNEGGRADMRGAVLRALQSDLDLQLKAGQLVTASRPYRDFSAAVVTRGGHLQQLLLRLAGDDGYHLELDGKVDNIAGQPKGTVRGHLAAESADSVAPLAALLGVPGALRLGDMRERAMVPLRLAGSLTLGGRAPTSADLTIDGESGGAGVKINARFDGGAGGWRRGRAEVIAAVDASDARRIAGLLFPDGMPAGRAGGTKPGRILVRAGGVPSEGLTSLATVDAGDLSLSFRGRVVLDDTGAKADGELEARAGHGTPLAALVGLAPALRADNVPVSARLKLAWDERALNLDKLALQLGGTRLTGKIAVSHAEGRRRIDATLNADDIAVASLLGPLLDRRFGAASAAEAVLLGQQSPWPDEPFNAAVFDAFDGQIRLNCKRLTLADGMALERAKVNVLLQPGKIDVKEIAGTAPGGEVKAALSIQKASAGAEVRGTLSFGIALEQIAGTRPPRASGPMQGRIAFSGRGVSPRAVMAGLEGKGSVALGEGRLPVLSPAAVAAAAGAALKAEPGRLAPVLRQMLTAGGSRENLAVGQTNLDLEIAGGQVRSTPLVVATGAGRASGTTRLDLKAMRLDAQWRLEAKAPDGAAAAKPLPAVTVTYRAPLATLSAAEMQVDAAALEQELAARRIEQDMEELERLRKLNEADPNRPPPQPAPAQGQPAGPAVPIPPFGHEVRPGTPG